MLFSDLSLIAPIQQALAEEGYTTPTPIQEQAIPVLLTGRDLLGCAQTGTGKTAAFAIPILQLLHQQRPAGKGTRAIRCLILTPTRELAIQINESFQAYGRHLPLKSMVVFGGVGQKPQTDGLRAGVDILVATPGRLLDLMNQGFVSLQNLSMFVLDEADRMLDMGFIHDVKKVIAKLPAQRHSLFFSATMPADVSKLAESILHNPLRVEVTPASSTADTIEQSLYFVAKEDKKQLLVDILEDDAIGSALVFTRTKHGADKVVKDLVKSGIKAEAIHGNKSQNHRQRALSSFKNRATRVLVATDIAARGIDIDELAYVINYEIPNIPETYVHRIGRTGRAGHDGRALSFCELEEVAYLKDIQKLIGKAVPVVTDQPYHYPAAAEEAASKRHTPAPKLNQREPREGEEDRPPQRGRQASGGSRGGRNAQQPAASNTSAGRTNQRAASGDPRTSRRAETQRTEQPNSVDGRSAETTSDGRTSRNDNPARPQRESRPEQSATSSTARPDNRNGRSGGRNSRPRQERGPASGESRERGNQRSETAPAATQPRAESTRRNDSSTDKPERPKRESSFLRRISNLFDSSGSKDPFSY